MTRGIQWVLMPFHGILRRGMEFQRFFTICLDSVLRMFLMVSLWISLLDSVACFPTGSAAEYLKARSGAVDSGSRVSVGIPGPRIGQLRTLNRQSTRSSKSFEGRFRRSIHIWARARKDSW